MNKRTLILLLVALIVAVFYGLKLRDGWRARPMQISYRLLPNAAGGNDAPLVFLLDCKRELTAVKVVLEREAQTNKNPKALWELVSRSNSIPVTHLVYGAPIGGMQPRLAGVPAVPLEPNVEYRLEIMAGKLHGERTFVMHPPATDR